MNLKAMLAKKLIKEMPGSVVNRLQDDDVFSSFAEIARLTYRGIGSFHHESILSALQNAKNGDGKVELVTKEGRSTALRRLPNGQIYLSVSEGNVDQQILEFSFLDPDSEVRFAALTEAEAQCWPELPSVEKWRKIIAERPLNEVELIRLITEINETPSQFLAVLKDKWKTGSEMCTDDFFPTSSAYYLSLAGPPPNGFGANEWINKILAPDVKRAITLSLDDGLKRALALNIDPQLSPVRFVEDIPDSDLLSALSRHVKSVSPLALLGISEIALARAEANKEFSNLASDAIERLFTDTKIKNGTTAAWKLIPNLVRIGLGNLSTIDELSTFPPFWRRLAAFAHAHVLVESLEMATQHVDSYVDWLGKVQTQSQVSTTFLDISQEPLWIPWNFSPRQLRASVVCRLMALNSLVDKQGLTDLVGLAFEALQKENGLIDMDMPGPLVEKGIRMSDLDGDKKKKTEPEIEWLLKITSELELNPIGEAWRELSVVSRLTSLDDVLLGKLAIIANSISISDNNDTKQLFFEALLSAANVAATQPSKLIGEAVASVLVREVHKFNDLSDMVLGYRILLISSGAITDRAHWMTWVGDQMSSYAFNLPKGETCRLLLVELDSLQSLLPIKERCFRRARKFAAAGMF